MQTEEIAEKIKKVEGMANYYVSLREWNTSQNGILFKNDIDLLQYRPDFLTNVGDILDAVMQSRAIGGDAYCCLALAPSSPLATYISLKRNVNVVDYNRKKFYSKKFRNDNMHHQPEGSSTAVIYWTIFDPVKEAEKIETYNQWLDIDTVYVAFTPSAEEFKVFKEQIPYIEVVNLFGLCNFNKEAFRPQEVPYA